MQQQGHDVVQAPANAQDIAAILGDTADTQYPIYRHGNSPDDHEVVTLCTAMFDLEAKRMKVWTGNPASPGSRTLQVELDLQTLQVLEA